jgi:hypothetical protein
MKKFVLLALLPFAALAQAQGPVPTPAPPTISCEQDLSGCTVSFSTSFSVAPTVIKPVTQPAQNIVNGCVIAPNDSVFNTRIDALPTDSNSATWTQKMLGYSNRAISVGGSFGLNVVDSATPRTVMNFHYTTLKSGASYPIPPLPDRRRETGSLTTDPNNDHHMVMVDRNDCHVYETYQVGVTGPGFWWNAASGWDYSGMGYALPSGADGGGATDAAALPLTPLLLRHSELEAGAINHALRFSSCIACIAHAFEWPAHGTTGGGTGVAPMGARFRLKASYDISKFPPQAQTVLAALKQYGMILADIGFMGDISADAGIYQDPVTRGAMAAIQNANINISNFEVVDESGLMIADSSSQAQSAVPAILTAATGVGIPYETYTVEAGTKLALRGWVTNGAPQGINWSIVSGPGTLSGNIYSAPASVVGNQSVSIKATAVADNSNPAFVTLNLIPAGAIRIDIGSTQPYRDSQGNLWSPDPFTQESGPFYQNYGINGWTGTSDPSLYSTYVYTWGDDIKYGPYVLAPGRYNITFLLGNGGCDAGTFDNGLIWGPTMTEVNGQDQLYTPAGCKVADTIIRTVTAEDGVISVAMRATGGQNTHSAPYLNGLSITPAN